jgi:hypothetical protein
MLAMALASERWMNCGMLRNDVRAIAKNGFPLWGTLGIRKAGKQEILSGVPAFLLSCVPNSAFSGNYLRHSL